MTGRISGFGPAGGVRRVVAVAFVPACAGLTGCSTDDNSPAPTPGSGASTVAGATSTPAESPAPTRQTSAESTSEAPGEASIRVVVAGKTLSATLSDNPAANSLLEQLPLTLDFADFGGQEVTAEPPRPLTMEGMPDGESAPAGTIGYYAPDGVVVLYYTDVGRYNGIVRLGRINGDISILKGWDEARPVTIERAD